MGDWVVLRHFNSSDDGPGTWAPNGQRDLTRPARFHECAWPSDFGCERVVEQHQKWKFEPEGGDVPEFTIEVAYKTHDRNGVPVSEGWRYVLKWLEGGENKSERRYGFDSKEEAVDRAKRRAKRVALTLTPVHVETYTPEV